MVAVALMVPMMAISVPVAVAADIDFAGGPLLEDMPLQVPNDHTAMALRFSAVDSAEDTMTSLLPNTVYEVKIRLAPTPTPSNVQNRGYVWSGSQWTFNRGPAWGAGNFPTVTTDAQGNIAQSPWIFFKFGNELNSGTYYILVSLNAGVEGATRNAAQKPMVTVLDMKTNGTHVHNGAASATTAQNDRRVIVAPGASTNSTGTVWAISRTETNTVDTDSNGIIDDEDWGLPGKPGDYRLAARSGEVIDIYVQQTRKVNDFQLRGPDEEIALGSTDTTAPSAPTGLAAVPGATKISLSWGASTDNVGVTGYRIYRWVDVNDVVYTPVHELIGTTTELTFDDSTVLPDVTYNYEVRATDAATNGSARSNTASAKINRPPVAVNDTYSTAQDTMLTVPAPGVLANDTDPDGNSLLAEKATDPAHGTLTLNANGSFSYTPAPGFFGTDSFTYRADDGYEFSAAATVTITVSAAPPVNVAPVLGAIGVKSVNELTQLAFTATATDSNGDTLTYSLTGAPSGAAINSATGVFTWTPSEAQGPGTYTITVVVSDGALTDSEAVTVTVAEVNVAPVLATIGNKSLTLGQTLTFTASAIDVDLPANTKTFSLGAGAPSGATITAGGLFSWTPSAAGTYSITVRVADGAATDTETITVTVSAIPPALIVTSIEGPNRFATAIAASMKAFTTSEYVIIATGANWPDALGGSALAGALDAPILLTRQDVLPAEVRAEIVRLGATKAIILGGTPAVSAAVASQIDAISGVTVERISGPNRYDTAIAVAARTIAVLGDAYDGGAFIATGMNFPDALGASPLAAAAGWPIYLANPNQGNNAGLVSVMRAAGVSDAILLGGANVVADSIRLALGATYQTRLSGANRYDTAVVVATYGVANAGLGFDKVALATGENFPDALAGGVMQAKDGSVLLLTPTNSLNANVAAKLSANKASIHEVRFLGSTAAVSAAVRTAVTNLLQ